MKDKRSQGEKKGKEKKPRGSAEHSPRNKREVSGDQHDKVENERHEMTERFEVTITKMNTEDEGESMGEMSFHILFLIL